MSVTTTISSVASSSPEPGQLVRVRGRHWVIADVSASAMPPLSGVTGDRDRLVTLTSVEDDRHGNSLQVLWGAEPGPEVPERATMPKFGLVPHCGW